MSADIIDFNAARQERDEAKPLQFRTDVDALNHLIDRTDELMDVLEPALLANVDEVWPTLLLVKAISAGIIQHHGHQRVRP